MSTVESVIADETPVLGMELLTVPLKDLHEHPKNPRTYFSERKLDEMAASMVAGGVHTPLRARRRIDAPGYELAAGARRRRAAIQAGLTHVPVVVSDMSDADFIGLLAFENSNREDPNLIDEARGWRMFMEETGASVKDVAARLGANKLSYVYSGLKLLDAIPQVQRALEDEQIKAGHGILIARLDANGQRRALRACEPPANDPTKTVSVRELAAWIKKNLHIDLDEAPFDISDAWLTSAGDCRVCEYRTGNAPDFEPGENLPNMCTRRECYDDKVQAFVTIQMRDLPASVVRISEARGPHVEGVLRPNDWIETRPGNPAAKTAFVVEGPRIGRQIQVLVQDRIADPPPAPKPAETRTPAAPRPTVTRSQAEIDEELREIQEREEEQAQSRAEAERCLKAERAIRVEILSATLGKVKWPPRKEEILPLLDGDCLADLDDSLDGVVQHEFGAASFPDLTHLSSDQLARMVVILAVERDFNQFAFHHGADTLHATAQRYGVDVAAIRARALEAEGGTRQEVVRNLAALGEKPAKTKPARKVAPAAKKASAPKKAAVKKSAPAKKAAAKKAPEKKGKK